MCDEPEHRSLLETIGDAVYECLPEKLQKNETFACNFGCVCGFIAGCIITKKAIDWLFPRGDDK